MSRSRTALAVVGTLGVLVAAALHGRAPAQATGRGGARLANRQNGGADLRLVVRGQDVAVQSLTLRIRERR